MAKTTKYPRQVVVRLTDEMYDRIEADAERNGRTVTQTVRFWLGRQMNGITPTALDLWDESRNVRLPPPDDLPDPCDTFSESGTSGLCGWCSRLEVEHQKAARNGGGQTDD